MSQKWINTLTLCSLLVSLNAAEVDSFTKRFEPLEDTTEAINVKTNEYLEMAVKEANEDYKGCHEEDLYKKMRRYFSNQYRGKLGEYIVNAVDLDHHPMTIPESVYQDFKWHQSIIQGFWGRVVNDPTASALKVNGVYIGTDKFEHFMGSGFKYFKTYHMKGEPIEDALKIGEKAESGFMGAVTTGVKSFGDLSANFNGMRFWNHVMQKRDDILGENIGPYVSCDEVGFKVVKKIDWASYIDDSYDEGINCSAFRNQKMVDAVNKRVREANPEREGLETCPVDRERLDSIKGRYKDIAPFIINERGHYSVKED